jgi:hypothetical protein
LEKSLTKNQTFTVCEYCDKERKQQSYYWWNHIWQRTFQIKI